MSECSEIFAPCLDPLCSRPCGKRDRTEINADAAKAVRGLTRDIRMATWAVIGTIAFIAAIAPQGVENIRAAQIANMEP